MHIRIASPYSPSSVARLQARKETQERRFEYSGPQTGGAFLPVATLGASLSAPHTPLPLANSHRLSPLERNAAVHVPSSTHLSLACRSLTALILIRTCSGAAEKHASTNRRTSEDSSHPNQRAATETKPPASSLLRQALSCRPLCSLLASPQPLFPTPPSSPAPSHLKQLHPCALAPRLPSDPQVPHELL